MEWRVGQGSSELTHPAPPRWSFLFRSSAVVAAFKGESGRGGDEESERERERERGRERGRERDKETAR